MQSQASLDWHGARLSLSLFHEDRMRLGHGHSSKLDGAWRSPFTIFVLLKSDLGCRCIEQRKVRATLSHHTS